VAVSSKVLDPTSENKDRLLRSTSSSSSSSIRTDIEFGSDNWTQESRKTCFALFLSKDTDRTRELDCLCGYIFEGSPRSRGNVEATSLCEGVQYVFCTVLC